MGYLLHSSQSDLVKWTSLFPYSKSSNNFSTYSEWNPTSSLWPIRPYMVCSPGHLSNLIYYFSSPYLLGLRHAASLEFAEFTEYSLTSEPLRGLFPLPGLPFPKPSHVSLPLLQISTPASPLSKIALGYQLALSSLLTFRLCGETVCLLIFPSYLLPRNWKGDAGTAKKQPDLSADPSQEVIAWEREVARGKGSKSEKSFCQMSIPVSGWGGLGRAQWPDDHICCNTPRSHWSLSPLPIPTDYELLPTLIVCPAERHKHVREKEKKGRQWQGKDTARGHSWDSPRSGQVISSLQALQECGYGAWHTVSHR